MSIHSSYLDPLSLNQRESLLSARTVLGEFFMSLERIETDPRQFMTDEYARRMGDQQSIRQSLVAYETTLLQIRVTDFSMSAEDTLELSFIATAFSEGMYTVSEARATMRRVGETWRVHDVVTNP
jgi:hypothetical protein